MKKTIFLCILILILIWLLVSGCGVPTPIPSPTPTPTPVPQRFIEADANLNKDTYAIGEEVAISLSLKNVTQELFQLTPFPQQLEILRPTPYDEPVHTFPAGTESRSLNPDEVTAYTLAWDQRDDQGQQVPYGYYYLRPGEIRYGDGWMSISFGRYVNLLILPAEGVLKKTIEVNEFRTVDGITITLVRAELTVTELKIYAFNVPPDYNLPQGSNLPPPQFMIHAEAEYRLNSGLAKKAGLSGIRFFDNGTEHIWEMLDPVPKGTKELTLVITKLGNWEGPWEFHVLLE